MKRVSLSFLGHSVIVMHGIKCPRMQYMTQQFRKKYHGIKKVHVFSQELRILKYPSY